MRDLNLLQKNIALRWHAGHDSEMYRRRNVKDRIIGEKDRLEGL